MKEKNTIAIIYAFLAALFYALNVPCSKVLLRDISPPIMSSFLYLGAGIGVGCMYLIHFPKESVANRLEKKDLPYTIAMVLFDIVAPILFMIGVRIGTAANASLLGNFEIVATTMIAFLHFHEKVSKRLWGAIAIVTMASALLSFSGIESFYVSKGSLFILGATICWGIENNCTRTISGKSTYQIVTIKGIGAGMGAFIVALVLGETLPNLTHILVILLLGFVSYGLSIFAYVRAQNRLGAAKTSAYYSIAPFIGVLLSSLFLKEKITVMFGVALILMIIGSGLVVYDTNLNS